MNKGLDRCYMVMTDFNLALSLSLFRDEFISDIGFVRSNFNLTDGLTKPMFQAALQSALSACRINTTTEQWIVRS